jgi:hypothetical protein
VNATERAEFLRNYVRLLAAVWADDAVAHQLQANPRKALGEYLIAVPDDATIDVKTTDGDPDADEQARLWDQAETTGTYTLLIPSAPEIETRELTDDELQTISAGRGDL